MTATFQKETNLQAQWNNMQDYIDDVSIFAWTVAMSRVNVDEHKDTIFTLGLIS